VHTLTADDDEASRSSSVVFSPVDSSSKSVFKLSWLEAEVDPNTSVLFFCHNLTRSLTDTAFVTLRFAAVSLGFGGPTDQYQTTCSNMLLTYLSPFTAFAFCHSLHAETSSFPQIIPTVELSLTRLLPCFPISLSHQYF